MLTVELTIPIRTEPLIGAPALTFTRWLPLGIDKGIALSQDGIDVTFWFDIQATWWASQTKEEELPKHVNVLAHYVKALVSVADVDESVAAYMENRNFSRLPDDSEKAIQSEYDKLGQIILRLVIERVNRLISYARAFKGQYWLLEYSYDAARMHGYFGCFKGRARIDNREWFRFQPSTGDSITLQMTAIALRQNVVHNGEREVNEVKLRQGIASWICHTTRMSSSNSKTCQSGLPVYNVSLSSLINSKSPQQTCSLIRL